MQHPYAEQQIASVKVPDRKLAPTSVRVAGSKMIDQRREEPEAEPYCRICYEHTVQRHNPLLTPCNCRGSLRHVHRRCLLRWVLLNEARPETKCHLCGAAYAVQGFNRLEDIPDDRGLFEISLKYPIILLLLAHYILLLMFQQIPRPLWNTTFALYSSAIHAAVHVAYLGLFLLKAKTRNIFLYVFFWMRYWAFVPGLRYALYVLYQPRYNELGYVADLWLTAYWLAHTRTLRRINDHLLE